MRRSSGRSSASVAAGGRSGTPVLCCIAPSRSCAATLVKTNDFAGASMSVLVGQAEEGMSVHEKWWLVAGTLQARLWQVGHKSANQIRLLSSEFVSAYLVGRSSGEVVRITTRQSHGARSVERRDASVLSLDYAGVLSLDCYQCTLWDGVPARGR